MHYTKLCVDSHFVLRAASLLCEIDPTTRWKHSWETLLHVETTVSHDCCRFISSHCSDRELLLQWEETFPTMWTIHNDQSSLILLLYITGLLNKAQLHNSIFLLLMPLTSCYSGQGSLLLPFIYYRFLTLRYTSRRNPYCRWVYWHARLS